VIRLLIAAGSAVLRAGLEALAASSPGIELVGAYPDLAAVDDLRPDVVLTAFPVEQLPASRNGAGPVYVLLADGSPTTWTLEAVRAGVRAVLRRDASAPEILAAVDAAASGLVAIEPPDLEALLPAAGPVAASGESPVLTPRELEVLAMLAEGAANKTIAWKLQISEHTVKFHVASVLAKLNASTRTEAVTTGIRRGLVML
jgi:two-component system, NarL family, response regulator YdfI